MVTFLQQTFNCLTINHFSTLFRSSFFNPHRTTNKGGKIWGTLRCSVLLNFNKEVIYVNVHRIHVALTNEMASVFLLPFYNFIVIRIVILFLSIYMN